MITMDKLYKNIKERRKALKMTQQELAEKIGLSDDVIKSADT